MTRLACRILGGLIADHNLVIGESRVELNRGRRRRVIQVHGNGIVSRQAKHDIAVAPILDERNVAVCTTRCFSSCHWVFTTFSLYPGLVCSRIVNALLESSFPNPHNARIQVSPSRGLLLFST